VVPRVYFHTRLKKETGVLFFAKEENSYGKLII